MKRHYKILIIATLIIAALLPAQIASAQACNNFQNISPIWVVDEDGDGSNGLHLWLFEDYEDPTTTGTDFGRLKYYNPSTATIRDVGDAQDLEAMAVNIYTGQAYLISKTDAYNGPGNANHALWTYDLNDAANNQGNIVLDLVAHISKPSGSSTNFEGLAFDPNTNRLYTSDPVDDDDEDGSVTDVLYYIDLTSLHTNPMQVTHPIMVGAISGLGETNKYVDAIEFANNGNLYMIDGTDDELYEVDPATGTIIDVLDNNISGGTGSSDADIESISWDPVTNRLIGMNNGDHQDIIEITLNSNGNNIVLSGYSGTPGMYGDEDFEASAMYAACTDNRVSLGNLVFDDENSDGVYNAGEGLDGIEVQLFASGQDPLSDIAVSEEITANGGFYHFEYLTPGAYFVHIPAAEFSVGSNLEYYISMDGAGADDQLDDDTNENGIDVADPTVTGISSAVITLTIGSEATDGLAESGAGNTMDNDADANGDMTVDFGFIASCDAPWNIPVVTADFSFNHQSVEAFSTEPLENVVLKFHNGDHQMFSDLTGFSGTFSGTGDNEDQCIVGIWIRSACNPSGDGPEYGEYVTSQIWDGLCGGHEPVVEVVTFEHGSTVILNGGPTVIDVGDYDTDLTDNDNDNDNDEDEDEDEDEDIHNSGGVGVPRPEIPGRDRINNMLERQVTVFPNPVRSYASITIDGLDSDEEWDVHIMSVNGRLVATKQVDNRRIDLSGFNLVSGIYFCTLENGLERISMKLMVCE